LSAIFYIIIYFSSLYSYFCEIARYCNNRKISLAISVEGLCYKRPIQCLASSEILTPHPRGERGGVNSSEDARHCSVLYICKYFVAISVTELLSPSRLFLIMQNLLVSFLATSAASMPCHVVSPHLNNSQHASRIKGQCDRYDRSDFGTHETDIFYKAAEKM
jgi:hypothetical protein